MAKFKIPIINNFYATNIFKAFILNAISVALVATMAIELRRELNNVKGRFYLLVNPLFAGSALTERQKAIVVATVSFLGAIFVYHFMYIIFGFGGGMLAPRTHSPYY